MNQAIALPTRKDEDFRYADLAALEQVWPVAVETIRVAAGESGNLALVLDGAAPVAREIAITLGDGASFDLRVLNAGSGYGRVAVRIELGRGASFTLGAAQLAGGLLEIPGSLLELYLALPAAFSFFFFFFFASCPRPAVCAGPESGAS